MKGFAMLAENWTSLLRLATGGGRGSWREYGGDEDIGWSGTLLGRA
jgi:hypothetical protein